MSLIRIVSLISCITPVWLFAPSLFALPPGFVVQTVTEPANFPSAMAFAPDGTKLFYTERFTGNIRVYDLMARQLLPTPFATVQVFSTGFDERGLLGIAADPEFAINAFVYVLHHRSASSGRITRFTDVDDVGTVPTILVDDLPANFVHNGGYLGFGHDGKLYVTIGDNGIAANAQDLTVIPGKVHRFNADGTIPSDNPIPGSSIWSSGLRNSFGFSFHPVTGSLLLSEAGPTSNDEINRIVKGGNYGWPTALGCAGDARFSDPLLAFTPVVTPNGNLVFASNRYPAEFLYNLFLGEWNTGRIRRSVLIGSPDTGAEPPTAFLDLPGDNILDLKMGPDGNLWFSTPTSIRRVVYSLSLSLPALGRNGTPAIGNEIILSLLGNPGDSAVLVLSSPGTAFRRLIRLGVIPPLGVASTAIEIPNNPDLVGRVLLMQGASFNSLGQPSVTQLLGILVREAGPSPACVDTQ
jgi:glucose/arabinose dehydrogenase